MFAEGEFFYTFPGNEFKNRIKREPSTLAVHAYLRDQFTDQVTCGEVLAAFWSGKEVRQIFGFLYD
jgi:hypothetical protein